MAPSDVPLKYRYRIGVDVGGTNTDAVVLNTTDRDNNGTVLAWSKAQTTTDVTDGILVSLRDVLAKSSIKTQDISYISIGTTHFLNAVVENDSRRLARVAVLRLGAPYTQQCPPFVDFPPGLRSIVEGHYALLDGGLEIDGSEIRPVSEDQIVRECAIIKAKQVRNIVIVGVFSSLARPGEQEEYVKSVIERELGAGQVNVVCSKDVGQVGLLERENAAILNASILTFAQRTIAAYRAVLGHLDLRCPLYLTQLDGTLITASEASRTPIRTFSNGPTNSMRGASYLSGLESAATKKPTVVIDVGGTTTDVGVLLPSGFPRKAAAFTEIGGVRTSFSMPDIYSIGLGGGSKVHFASDGSARSVGPTSVGHNIAHDALSFGGSIPTATDLAIAAALAPELARAITPSALRNLSDTFSAVQIESGVARIQHMLETAIDKMKTEPGDVEVLLVGGGSIIVPPVLRGVSKIVRPPFFSVANAVGAAIGRVSGEIDRVEVPGDRSMDQIVDRCKTEATTKAIEAGADPSTVTVTEVSVVELPYVANRASRIVVRAVGDLRLDEIVAHRISDQDEQFDYTPEVLDEAEKPEHLPATISSPEIDIYAYRPSVSSNGEWSLTELDLEFLADGCAVLGCGGGGATYPAFLPARAILSEGQSITVVDHTYFDGEGGDGWILPVGYMGSPSVGSERIPAGVEVLAAVKALMDFHGISSIAAVLSTEIGGKNGLEPMLLPSRSQFHCPVLDGDLMGRAYPRLNQILPSVYKKQEGSSICPVAGADAVGNSMIIPSARNNLTVEMMLRATCTELGSSLALAIAPMRVSEFREYAIPRTTSQAWWIGRAIAMCRKSSNVAGIPRAVAELQGGKVLFVGKIVDVQRVVRGGFTHGKITIAPLHAEEVEVEALDDTNSNDYMTSKQDKLVVPFQNENLVAELHGDGQSPRVLCCVPDLIAVLDLQNGSSIGTQDYRYGLRVSVVGLACTPRWQTPEALAIGGPDAFGLGIKYVPIGAYEEPRSVITEYRRE